MLDLLWATAPRAQVPSRSASLSLRPFASPMNELVVLATTCSRCGEPLPHGEEVCPVCDSREPPAVVQPGGNSALPVPAEPGPVVGLTCLDNRWLVVGLLLPAIRNLYVVRINPGWGFWLCMLSLCAVALITWMQSIDERKGGSGYGENTA